MSYDPGMSRPKVLFLCTANSCRSQMAEGWLRYLARNRVEALSAGTDPVDVNPRAIAVMREAGVDISGQTPKPVTRFLHDPPDLLIAVCSAAAERCPVFPGRTRVLRWPVEDPAGTRGTEEQILQAFRETRDEIGDRIRRWIADGFPPLAIER